MEEIWKDIEGYEGLYQVSNLGRVKSLSREVVRPTLGKYTTLEIIRKSHYDKDGYLTLSLSKGSKYKLFKIHRLVATAFIPNPENKPQVNHINGIKTDNTLENLEWVTASENVRHAYESGLVVSLKGEKHNMCKLTSELVKLIRNDLMIMTQKKVAEKYGISQQHVSDINTGKRWKHI